MTEIKQLIPDIHKLLKSKDAWFTPELAQNFANEVSLKVSGSLNKANRDFSRPRENLWFSELGPQCPCALWYRFNKPNLAEPLPPAAIMKYTYGHILEAQVIAMAKASGHEVTGEQDEIRLDGVVGRRDCVIDGCLVDVKSANSRTFQRFKNGSIHESDLFGYLDQLDGYVVGCANDPLVRTKDVGYLLIIDKELGNLFLYEHIVRESAIRERIKCYREIVSRNTPPACECRSIEDGKSGNYCLDVKASYNPFKYCCKPELRTFLFAGGKPKFYTKVVRRPQAHVIEIDRDGNIVR